MKTGFENWGTGKYWLNIGVRLEGLTGSREITFHFVSIYSVAPGIEGGGSTFFWTKYSGLKLRVFHVTNGILFSGYSNFPEFLTTL